MCPIPVFLGGDGCLGVQGTPDQQVGPAGAGQSPCVPAEGDALPLHPATPWHEPGAPGSLVVVVGARLDTGRLGARLCTPGCWGEGAARDAKTPWPGQSSPGGAASQETQRGADPGAPLVQGESGQHLGAAGPLRAQCGVRVTLLSPFPADAGQGEGHQHRPPEALPLPSEMAGEGRSRGGRLGAGLYGAVPPSRA